MIPIIKPWLGEEEAEAARQAILSGWVAQGPRVAAFEAAVAARVGANAGVAVSSATAGLHLALVVAGIGPGDEVIAPSLSFIATANAVAHAGARPVFADVESASPNITVHTIEAALTPATRAVLAVHQLGVPCDIAGIAELCQRRGLVLIEDAACAMGSTVAGRPVGAHTDLAVFSFHPRKLLTTGEGGLIACRRPELAERLRRLRQHAMDQSDVARHGSRRFVFERYLEVGWNYRMTDVQAAIGRVQLGRLNQLLLRRRAQAARYRSLLARVPDLQLAGDPPYGSNNYQTFWVRVGPRGQAARDAALAALNHSGVGARRAVMAAHLEPAWRDHPRAALPETERWAADALALPLFHAMTETEQDQVVHALGKALA